MKLLNELFECDSNTPIYTIHNDSRYVLPYSVFFCLEGLTVDGHQYIDDAIFQGARCIVHSKELNHYQDGVVYIKVDDTSEQLHRVASMFYDNPSHKIKTVGVTGSAGKTIVSSLVWQALSKYCLTGYIGTLAIQYSDVILKMPYATPDILFMQRHLSKMVDEGIKVASIESSSHGLALGRVDSIQFDIGVLTNIFDEHLDFHGTIEEYVASKVHLFEMLDESGHAVLNGDDEYFEVFSNSTKANIISYGIDGDYDVVASNIDYYLDCTSIDLTFKGVTHSLQISLLSKVNVYNALALVGVMCALGNDENTIIESILAIHSVDGRLEKIDIDVPFDIIIDHCQTLQNYEDILKFVHQTKQQNSRIIAVYGGQSKRKSQNRKIIGELSNKYLNHLIITELDDRGESVIDIAKDITAELHDITNVVISDRSIAIEQALEIAMPGDVVLLLGKGAENFMSLQVGQRDYLGDHKIVRNYFNRDVDQNIQ